MSLFNNRSFIIKNGIITGYKGDVPKRIVLPVGTKEVALKALYGVNNVDGFELICNDELEVIGQEAFAHTSCTKVVFNKSLKKIKNNAFFSSDLKEIINPSSAELDRNAFEDNYNLSHYEGFLKSKYCNAFENCSMYVEDQIIINDYVFEYSKKLNPDFKHIYQLVSATKDKDLIFLGQMQALAILLQLKNNRLLSDLLDLDLFDKKSIDYGIKIAIKQEQHEAQILMMNYKNKHGWIKSVEDTIKEKFSLEDGETNLF